MKPSSSRREEVREAQRSSKTEAASGRTQKRLQATKHSAGSNPSPSASTCNRRNRNPLDTCKSS
eukprot:3000843-Pleurochrysis_carterae.AAC.2